MNRSENHPTERIKVLLVAPDLPIIGGQTVQARKLLEQFREHEDVYMELQPINPSFFPRLQKIKYLRTILTSIKYISDLFIKAPRFDVIHIFSASYYSFLLAPTPAVLIARLFGKRTILNYRSGEAADHLKKWKRSAGPVIRMFDAIITPSGYLVDVFAEHGIEARAIFNTVDTKRYRFRHRDPLRPVFLSNRNFEPLYNVSCILRAFAIVQQTVPNANLMVVGDGRERNKLIDLAKSLNLQNIEFAGRVAPEKMPEIYDKADIYLNSPDIDNMPNSIIEAFACGLPVVSTDAGGIPYIVEDGETGHLVAVNDHEALARKALSLLKERESTQAIIKAALEACTQYTWDNVVDQWIELYRDLAKR